MASGSVFQGVLSLWGSNYNGNMNFFLPSSINQIPLIDCPVASIGSTSNKICY
jgi:hypothetical protein